jgi:septum formation protein
MDKAGAYAIQDADVPTVDRIDGCYCAVMGLPLWRLKRMLERRGVECRVPDETLAQCVVCPERNL